MAELTIRVSDDNTTRTMSGDVCAAVNPPELAHSRNAYVQHPVVTISDGSHAPSVSTCHDQPYVEPHTTVQSNRASRQFSSSFCEFLHLLSKFWTTKLYNRLCTVLSKSRALRHIRNYANARVR